MAIIDPLDQLLIQPRKEKEEKKRKQELLAQKMDATPLPPIINPNPATPLPTEYAGFVRSGNRLLLLAPDGTPYTNFPVALSEPMSNSDIVNRALQPPQPLPPPQQPMAQPGQPAITMTPGQARNEQFANSKQWQTTMMNEIKELKMLGLDPTEYIAEEKPGLTAGTLPEVQVRRKTPQEKQEDWINLNTLAMAGGGATIGPDGKPQAAAAPPIEVFDNTGAADAWIYTTAPDKNNKQDYAARLMYWQAAKPIRDKILGAAIRHPKFESKEEVQKFIQDLGVDARFKQLAINTMEKFLEKANPDLIANIRGDKLVEQANDKAILDFARQHATWAGADDMPDKELIVTAKKDPVLMAQMRRENRLFEQDPITHTPIIRPDTIESQAEKQFTMSSKQRQLKVEEYKALAKADPNLVFRLTPKGDPELVTKQVVLDENAERARKTRADEMAERKELYDIQKAEREMEKFDRENTPEFKRWLRNEERKATFMERRLIKIEEQHLKDQANIDLDPDVVEANYAKALNELETNPRYQPSPAPGEAPVAAAQQPQSSTEQPAVSLAPPQVGEVRKGYIYLGGDPSLPTSWRRQ